MMSRLGDERGRAVLREHERITREVLKANGGTEVKTMGDGFMASFGSVTKAVGCAVALQKAIDEQDLAPRRRLDLRPYGRRIRKRPSNRSVVSASTPASRSRRTATCSGQRSSWRRGSRRKRKAARSSWRTRCAGCARGRDSCSRTGGSSSRRASRSPCACTR